MHRRTSQLVGDKTVLLWRKKSCNQICKVQHISLNPKAITKDFSEKCDSSETPPPNIPQEPTPLLPSIDIEETLALLECPVCLESLIPPIFQCKFGHALCNECIKKVFFCPSCKCGHVNIRNILLDRLTNIVGEVQCPYAADGCPEHVKYIAKKEHKLDCLFRPFVCLHSETGCQFEGTPASLVAHLVQNHDYQQFRTHEINFLCNRDSQTTQPDGDHLWQKHIYSCFDKHFLLRVNRPTGQCPPSIYLSLCAIHPKHLVNGYMLSIEGRSRKFLFEGLASSTQKGVKLAESNRECLVVSQRIVFFISGGTGSETDLATIDFEVLGEIFP